MNVNKGVFFNFFADFTTLVDFTAKIFVASVLIYFVYILLISPRLEQKSFVQEIKHFLVRYHGVVILKTAFAVCVAMALAGIFYL